MNPSVSLVTHSFCLGVTAWGPLNTVDPLALVSNSYMYLVRAVIPDHSRALDSQGSKAKLHVFANSLQTILRRMQIKYR